MNIDYAMLGKSIGNAMESIGTYSAKAAAQANSISRSAQSAQGAFNQNSADIANELNQNAMSSQWAFNSAQANAANLNQLQMWNNAADWNDTMWQKAADFNKREAEKNREFQALEAQKLRDWQTEMANTSYQRAVNDMSKAGLNPILAATGGGINTSIPGGAMGSGSSASIGGAQMSSASAQMASGGLLGANSASESNFVGQMEQMSSTLALLGAVFSGISSAADAAGGLGKVGEDVMDGVSSMVQVGQGWGDKVRKWADEKTDQAADWIRDTFNIGTKKKGQITNRVDESQYLRYNAWNNSTYKYTKPKG